jgi:hypothetical protein
LLFFLHRPQIIVLFVMSCHWTVFNKLTMVPRTFLLLVVAVGVNSASECSNECEAKFLTGCVEHHCSEGKDGPTLCMDELDENSGPLTAVCETGCYMTERMELSACPESGAAAGDEGGLLCSEACETEYNSCLTAYFSDGIDGEAECSKELAAQNGPFATQCSKGCIKTEEMVATMCSAECEDKYLTGCVPHHCENRKDGISVCKRELASNTGPLADTCKQGCLPSKNMVMQKCPWEEEESDEWNDDNDDVSQVALAISLNNRVGGYTRTVCRAGCD